MLNDMLPDDTYTAMHANPYESPQAVSKPQVYDSIWISSADHLETLQQAHERSSFWPRHLWGAYELPDGFPFLRAAWGLPWRVPVIFFAHGCIDVQRGRLDFRSTAFTLPLNVLHNVCTTLTFTFASNDVLAIEPYEFHSPLMTYFDMTFVRIRTRIAEERLSDILLSVATKVPVTQKLRDQNRNLLADLSKNLSAP